MVVRLVALMAVLAVCCSPAESATRGNSVGKDKPEVERRFDELYRAYKEAPDASFVSSMGMSSAELRCLQRMIKLGPAVTPYLMEKLKETKDANLTFPIWSVTRKRFKKSEWPEDVPPGAQQQVKLYLDWWESKVDNASREPLPGPREAKSHRPQSSERHTLRERFKDAYDRYKNAPEPDPGRIHSSRLSTEARLALGQMVDLGPAVTPLLMKKLKETKDPNLCIPIMIVTKKRFEEEEWPEGRLRTNEVAMSLLFRWWESKVDNARSEFEEAYSRWQEAKSSESWQLLRTKRYVYDSEHQKIREKEELTEAGKALHSMEMMGVVALPYVMEHLREGDHDLLVLAERLTGDAVRAGGRPKARAEKYLAWWKKNERKWNILAARRRAQEEDDKEAAG